MSKARDDVPRAVLFQALRAKIAGRRVLHALFTTFSFDPAFFEEHVLPVLFDQSFAADPELRLLELEVSLGELRSIAVYYDRGALCADVDRSPRLDVARFGVSRPKGQGCFHPKIVALLVADERDAEGDGADVGARLVLGVLSANLTRPGWWENVECAEILELVPGERTFLKVPLSALLKEIERAGAAIGPQPSIGAVCAFVQGLGDLENKSSRGVLRPRMFVGKDEELGPFLRDAAGARWEHMELVAPFIDEDAGAIERLVEELRPGQTLVALPRGRDGEPLCTRALFERVEAMREDGVRWGVLPGDVVRRRQGDDEVPRHVHAKVIRLWNEGRDGREGREVILSGSANLTRAAHGDLRAGNLEASVVVGQTGAAGAWLTPLGKQDRPTTFPEKADDEDEARAEVPPVTITYAWDLDEAAYLWDPSAVPPPRVTLGWHGGTHDFAPVAGAHQVFPKTVAVALRERLRGSALVTVDVGHGPAHVLVHETGMAHRPSRLDHLTASQILHFWSLLSAEQRQSFLGQRLAERLLLERGVLPHGTIARTVSLFDRFAGIYLAFGKLRDHVERAVGDDRRAEAAARLFGRRFDSLPSLLDRVLAVPAGEDPVEDERAYVTLLTAKQLVDQLRDAHPDLFIEHRDGRRALEEQLDRIDEIRERFTFGEPIEREAFFAWFERQFLKAAVTPEAP